jgi:hypothetical protein
LLVCAGCTSAAVVDETTSPAIRARNTEFEPAQLPFRVGVIRSGNPTGLSVTAQIIPGQAAEFELEGPHPSGVGEAWIGSTTAGTADRFDYVIQLDYLAGGTLVSKISPPVGSSRLDLVSATSDLDDDGTVDILDGSPFGTVPGDPSIMFSQAEGSATRARDSTGNQIDAGAVDATTGEELRRPTFAFKQIVSSVALSTEVTGFESLGEEELSVNLNNMVLVYQSPDFGQGEPDGRFVQIFGPSPNHSFRMSRGSTRIAEGRFLFIAIVTRGLGRATGYGLIQLTGPADSAFFQEVQQLSPEVRLAVEIQDFDARIVGLPRSVDTEGTFEATFRVYIPNGG